MNKTDKDNVNNAAGVARVKGVFVQDEYGTRRPIFCGRSIALDLLQRGLWIDFECPVDPATINRASCYVAVDIPFPLSNSERSTWGNQLVGFHSLSIAARSQLSRKNEIHWIPHTNVAAFLERVLTADQQPACFSSFADNWEVSFTNNQQRQWYYNSDRNEVIIYDPVMLENLGNVCLNRQAIENDAQYVGLSAIAQQGDLGIIFNWKNDQDYWLFACERRQLPGVDFYLMQSCQTIIEHFIGGSVVHRIEGPVLRCDFPEYVDLDIKQANNRLIFGGQVRSIHGHTTDCLVSVDPLVPTKFDMGSRIGLFRRHNASVVFTRMDIIYPDVKLRLIPPSGEMRLMVRLIIRNNFMHYKPSQLDGRISLSSGISPCQDYDMWFWLTLSHELYGYSVGNEYRYGSLSGNAAPTYRGIGADLMGVH